MSRNLLPLLKYATLPILVTFGLFYAITNGWAASSSGVGEISGDAVSTGNMALQVYGEKEKINLLCDTGDPLRDCGDVLIGDAFSIDVIATGIPAEGYTRFQTIIEYDDKILNLQQQDGFDEVIWPDEGCDLVGFGEEAKDVGRYRITCKRSGDQNSFHTGALANIQFVCKQKGRVQIDIVGGESFADPDLVSYYFRPVAVGNNFIFLKSDPGDSVLIDCINPTPTPTPTPTDTQTPTPTDTPTATPTSTPTATRTATPPPEITPPDNKAKMSLRVYGDKEKTQVLCGAGPVHRKCSLEEGRLVVVEVVADNPPKDGYTAYHVALQFDTNLKLLQQPGLTENKAPNCGIGSETKTPGHYEINCKLGPTAYAGPLANVQFDCKGGSAQIDLLGGTSANSSYYVRPSVFGNLVFLKSVPKPDSDGKLIADSVLINCPDGTPPPTKTPAPTRTPTPVPTQVQGRMALELYADTEKSELVCGTGPVHRRCPAPGGAFSLDVLATQPPPNGYTAYQVHLQYGPGLMLKPQPGLEENRAPDCGLGSEAHTPPADSAPGVYRINCKLGQTGYTGPLVNVFFNCVTEGIFQVDLVGGKTANASAYVSPSIFGNLVFLASEEKVNDGKLVADSILVDCSKDGDGDGCQNHLELGPDPQFGGLRDPSNPWDFYDVDGDGVVTIAGDILAVARHFGTTPGGPAYSEVYDRGPSTGPYPWNMTAPDGSISVPVDILGAAAQFGHSCEV